MNIAARTGFTGAGLVLFAGISLAQGPQPGEEFEFDGPVFDIAATPSGSILVADFDTIREIRANGVHEVTSLPVVVDAGAFEEEAVTFINGLAPVGNGSFFATRSGLDLAVGAALFRATPGDRPDAMFCYWMQRAGTPCEKEGAVMAADIESFTLGNWPVNAPGQQPGWKNPNCEPPGGFSAGPHTNPHHLTALSASEVLIADAAGNTLLYANSDGQVELVATFDPVTDPDTDEPLVQFPLDENTNCPVEPVPTAVAIGADGAYYVGGLTGAVGDNFAGNPTPEGLSSVWRIEAGVRNARCPSDDCVKAVTGLNSVIDAEFGPDGQLYVVEYEKNGFLATVAPDLEIELAGGSVKRCDVTADSCETIHGGDGSLFLPGAITFDKAGNLWLLDNVFAPRVRGIEWQ